MNSAPPLLTGTIVLLVGFVAVGRWLLVNETAVDKLINRMLAWDIGAVVVSFVAAGFDHPELGQRLFLGIGALALSNGFGCAVLLDGADRRPVNVRQRRYDARAAVFGVVVVLCALGDELGLHLDHLVDWVGILWATTGVCMVWAGALLVRACLRELCAAGMATREKLAYSALLFFGVYVVVASAVGFVRIASGTPPGEPGIVAAIGSFMALAVLALLVAIPLVEALIARAHLDLESRQCRRLRPLWHDLTRIVPEVVLPTDRPRGSSSRLYRMTVEIRDALLHLKHFTPDNGAACTDNARVYAQQIAEALQRKQQGIPVSARDTSVPFPATDQTSELRNLLALSREWPRARAAASRASASRGLISADRGCGE
ncbi:MAB_1171c family putative transporter [Nocardia altamirensis]|uniref:MAB_1171c family putative transporter n=1 Tax=Nocardia altamirensis TaxID=472158 RepID=UPI00084048FA|nr:MAB_1171c family putative transporter [Nocardia altamirensis]